MINDNSFLKETEPISRIFGLDRGKAIDRYYIDSFLKRESSKILIDKKPVKILEIGDTTYSRRYFPNAMEYDALQFDKGQDLTKQETLKKSEYDIFICTQTFNFIYDYKAAVMGAYSTLRTGGTLLASVAGNISQVSRYDMDRWGHFWGFTYEGIRRAVAEIFGADNVQVFPFGNVLAATAFIQGLAQEDLPDLKLLDQVDADYAIVIGVKAIKND